MGCNEAAYVCEDTKPTAPGVVFTKKYPTNSGEVKKWEYKLEKQENLKACEYTCESGYHHDETM